MQQKRNESNKKMKQTRTQNRKSETNAKSEEQWKRRVQLSEAPECVRRFRWVLLLPFSFSSVHLLCMMHWFFLKMDSFFCASLIPTGRCCCFFCVFALSWCNSAVLFSCVLFLLESVVILLLLLLLLYFDFVTKCIILHTYTVNSYP